VGEDRVDARFVRVELAEIREAMQQHLEALPGPVDSFYEDHVLSSSHHRIELSGETAGFASIHLGRLITQFCLAEPYRRHGQELFQRVRRLENAGAAFVPTCDEFFLAHALDDYRLLAKQAYFFTASRTAVEPEVTREYSLRQAEPADAGFIQEQSGDFFEQVERQIQAGELFLTCRDGESVGFGVLARSHFCRNVASIGMFTSEPYRNQGVGTATIALLITECRGRGLRAVAGCWYYNHASKRTLERAGMVTGTRLLKIDY
jgi:RimJ/RimL family protein N-acetyltransferase